MIQLSDHFNYKKILKFTGPSVAMMVFASIYGVVDGFFVSNFAGKSQFAAVNFIMPVIMAFSSFGFMFGTGGSALIAKYMGEGEHDKAEEIFSQNIAATLIWGIFLSTTGMLTLPFIATALGADGEMLRYSVLYGRMTMLSLPFFMLQYEFQALFSTAEKPHLGLAVTLTAGFANMILDALFCAGFGWGIRGAAAATVISEYLGGGIPLIYFCLKNSSRLHIRPFTPDIAALFKVMGNGSSELMSNISSSLVGMLFNIQLLKYAGENGVAAYGVLMYVNFVFISMFLGYSVGIAPVISYNFGARNKKELKGLFKRSISIILAEAILMFSASHILGGAIADIFVGYDAELKDFTAHAFREFSFSFLFCGFSIFGSSFFTALNNGLISALISFLRTLLFEAGALLILPLLLGIDGIWFSVVAAEIASVTLTAIFIFANRKKYGYL